MPATLENSAMATGLKKKKKSISIPKKADAKKYSKYHIIALISHTSKEILKIF